MFFIATVILISAGVILVRQNKEEAGYALMILGWVTATIVTALTSSQWDAGFITFFMGIAFIWFVQTKNGKQKKLKR